MSSPDWQPFEECDRYITQHNGSGEYRWCHRFDWHKDGRAAAYDGGGDVSTADLASVPWTSGMAPGHGDQGSERG